MQWGGEGEVIALFCMITSFFQIDVLLNIQFTNILVFGETLNATLLLTGKCKLV